MSFWSYLLCFIRLKTDQNVTNLIGNIAGALKVDILGHSKSIEKSNFYAVLNHLLKINEKKNLSAVLIRQKKKLSLLNLDVPELNNGYVLVKMKFAGICHTQLNEISGILGKDKFLPHCWDMKELEKLLKLEKEFKV